MRTHISNLKKMAQIRENVRSKRARETQKASTGSNLKFDANE